MAYLIIKRRRSSRSHRYQFRIRIPDDLRHLYFGHRYEIRRSLKTPYLSEARHKAELMAGGMQQIFRYIRRRKESEMVDKLTPDKINEIVQEHLQGILEGFEEDMVELKRPLTEEQLDDKYKGYWSVGGDKKEALAKGDYEGVHHNADSLLKAHELTDTIKKDSTEYRSLCREILKAQVDALKELEMRVYGNYSDSGDKSGLNLGSKIVREPASILTSSATTTMEAAAEDYWSDHSGDIKPRSRTDYRILMDHIVQHFGPETPLQVIDFEAVRSYRDGLRSGVLSIRGKPLSVNRVNNFLGMLNSIFKLAMLKDKTLTHNPAASGL